MAQIRLLSEDLVNQIAAGEVVDRPASVVKELVENALDAEATRIEVRLAEGGNRWLAVVDNGFGIARDQAESAFQRHATSKLRSAADLEGVATLGFRGEALPSIASVARVRMRTRREADAVGTELRANSGKIDEVHSVSCAAGTCVEVAELFERVPARRKFLKSPATEGSHVLRWLERIALARPDLRFSLERDGRPAVSFPPTRELRERVIAVLPSSLGERLVPVAGETGIARVAGFTTPTDVHRGGTGDMHLFVNARPVRDRMLLHAVRSAYWGALPRGRHPACVIYLDIEPEFVDVNVHPAKWEVRFREPGVIRELVREAVVRSLGVRKRPGGAPGPRPEAAGYGTPLRGDFLLAGGEGEDRVPDRVEDAPRAHEPPFRFCELVYVGSVLGTFLVLEAPGHLVLIDQHAAHERVLFERMRGALLSRKLERQVLLVPESVQLARSAADALAPRLALLERAGIEVELGRADVRGRVPAKVRAIPALLAERRGIDWPALLEETASAWLDPESRELREGLEAAIHDVLATAACHSACRKGDRLDPREVAELLAALDEEVWFPNCPHGRPVVYSLEQAEIERRFLRR